MALMCVALMCLAVAVFPEIEQPIMSNIERRTTIRIRNHRPRLPPPPPEAPAVFDVDEEASSVPVSHYMWILRREWWKMALFAALMTTAAFVVSSRLTRIYESTATVDIDRQTPPGVVGQRRGPFPNQ